MFGLTGADLRLRAKLEISTEAMDRFPEGRAALQVMVRSVERIIESQRIQPVDPWPRPEPARGLRSWSRGNSSVRPADTYCCTSRARSATTTRPSWYSGHSRSTR
jgi:hypothetical protein